MSDSADRRAFLERMTIGAMALATTAVPMADALAEPGRAHGAVRSPWSDAWLDKLTGTHKQFFDAISISDSGMGYAMGFLDLNHEAYGLSDHDLTAVVGLRHLAMPVGLDDATWAKYKIGEVFKITDPATKAIATRNPYLRPEGMSFAGSEIPALMNRGVIFTVCNRALTHMSARLAAGAGVSADVAKQEWTAGLVPGAVLVPIGVLAVNRAQEKGCTYCYAG